MNKDVLIFDDNKYCTLVLSHIVNGMGLTPVVFNKPSEALEHLTQREEAPLAYFVDMNPYGSSVSYLFESNPEQYPELPLPEKMYDYLISKGWTNNFYFMSRHRSIHDDEVLKRTGAQFLLKELWESVYTKLEEIARNANE
jgi:hypothetical protein